MFEDEYIGRLCKNFDGNLKQIERKCESVGQDLNREMRAAINGLPEGTPLLLHACCGPCAAGALPRLLDKFDVTVYYYNPNIGTLEEYNKRLDALKLVLRRQPAPVRLLAEEWQPQAFISAAGGLWEAPEGGARCEACFELRLRQAARVAAAEGFAWFCSTLSVSPHKNAALLHRLGSRAGAAVGVRYLPSDFKKQDGYQNSVRLCKEWGIYRQSYCGCVSSKK